MNTLRSQHPSSTMDECSSNDTSVLSRIGCILTYGGGARDIAINYALFILNSVWCCRVAVMATASATPNTRKSYYTSSAISLLFVVAFQITLCLILGCSGISIIWCAQAGWIVHHRYHQTHSQAHRIPKAEIGVVVVDVLAILYYATTTEAITTVAHFCAIMLGSLLSFLVTRKIPLDQTEYQSMNSSTEALVST